MRNKGRHMDPLQEMRAANPVSGTELRDSIDPEQLERAMGRAIAVADATASQIPAGPSSRRRRVRLALGGGLACAAAIAGLVLFGGGSVGGGGPPAFAAAAIEVAEANPRLLVTQPGWKVSYAGEFEVDAGEVSFGDGAHRFDVHWYPARFYRGYLRDRAFVSKPRTSILFGRRATTVRYDEGEYATMLAPQGNVFVEVRGRLGDRAEYEAVLRSLRQVDVDTWLAAMPPSVVRPDVRAVVVERMLRGVPLPPGFDSDVLASEQSVLNRYQLAAKVAGAVSCGWVESWLAATKVGDRPRAREAVEAMATWKSWSMMRALSRKGGWSSNIRYAAHELTSGHLRRGPAGAVVRPDGTGYELGPSWAVALNCTSRYWRRPLER